MARAALASSPAPMAILTSGTRPCSTPSEVMNNKRPMLPTRLPAASVSTPSRPVMLVVTKGIAICSSWLNASVTPERAR